MPIRIYALAKQLKLDSKVMADICEKAGVTGKGSALASLTDEEVVKLKAFMGAPKSGKGGAATLAAYRWQYIVSGVQEPRFQQVLGELTSDAQRARIGSALAPLLQ